MLKHIYRYWKRTKIYYERVVAMRSPYSENIYHYYFKIRYDKYGKRLFKIPRWRYIVDTRKAGGTYRTQT